MAVALVATGCAGLADDEDEATAEALFAEDPVRSAMRVFLSRVPRAELVDLLLDAADENEAVADVLWEATAAWHGRQHDAS